MATSKNSRGKEHDRKKQILRAAIEVFAERGFHRTRVSDIAKRAGVAYGLIYHYFESKDDVLNSVFEENWGIFLKVLKDLEADHDRPANERLGKIAELLIGALTIEPAMIHVIIQEVSRSDRFVRPGKYDAFQEAFAVVASLIRQGQAQGVIRKTIDPHVGSFIYFGALETICTGFTLGAIPCGTVEEAETLKSSVKETLLSGLVDPEGLK